MKHRVYEQELLHILSSVHESKKTTLSPATRLNAVRLAWFSVFRCG